ncbi:DUF1292 domain-containing protein [Tepidibacter mesophilus]|uniref:DUF1292 domain-containing protein n=1 Tax=Tepidibacter mesophilus TaxID=655607 RepID=UPI000C0776EE|nr:DUF1292 domain-containing protein [Tepidibacter mesophilus]
MDSNLFKDEKNKYEKIYVDINYAINDINDFLSEDKIKQRKYISRLNILKDYINLIDTLESKYNKKSIFKVFEKEDYYINKLGKYKEEHESHFKQIENCLKCSCFRCIKECNFDTCLGCRLNSKIVVCDHKNVNSTVYNDYTLNLTNNDTNKEDIYKVLSTIQVLNDNKRYIVIQNIHNYDEKYILYHYPGIKEDNYGEISDACEFDYIAEIFNSCNLD